MAKRRIIDSREFLQQKSSGRPFVLGLLMLAGIVVAGLFWGQKKCEEPIGYSIGAIDSRFNVSKDDVERAAKDAASRWNTQSGRTLLSYNANSKLKIDLIYDDRQAKLDQIIGLNNSLANKNSNLENLRNQFQTQLSKYQTDLAAYNQEVANWNEKGGAPPEVYSQLQTEKYSFDQRKNSLIQLGNSLNIKVDDYNSGVSTFNKIVDSSKNTIITQGLYRTPQEKIEIYTFGNYNELRLVLMHELGHALGFDHTSGEQSIMYYLLESQDLANPVLSNNDKALISNRCNLESANFYYNLLKKTRQSINDSLAY